MAPVPGPVAHDQGEPMKTKTLSTIETAGRLALISTLTVFASLAQAQVVGPLLLESEALDVPTGRFGMPLEGWVALRYTVNADGSTADIRVVDKMPAQLSERDVVRAAEEWTFNPATADGQAIDWFNNETVVVFDSPDVPAQPSPPMLQAYMEADELLKEGDLEKALRSNERTLASAASRLTDYGLSLVQNTVINIGLEDPASAYASIVRATDPRVPLLADADLGVALQYRNALELQLGDADGALQTFERRNELSPVPDSDSIAQQVPTIREALRGDSVIAVTGRIFDDNWRHTPSRRTFTVADVEGTVESILAECDRRAAELEYAPDTDWTLPASWGSCALTVSGRKNTTFKLYEFPAN